MNMSMTLQKRISMTIKKIPRLDGPDLTIDEDDLGFMVDVHEAFGLPPEGWVMYVPKR
jgi:hypothetical protein